MPDNETQATETQATALVDKSTVAVGTAKVSGAIFVAPTSVSLPTDGTTELASGYECMGYTTDAGVTIVENSSTKSLRVWEGLAEARVVKTEYAEQVKFTPAQLIETVVKAMWGEDAVDVGEDGKSLSIRHHGRTIDQVNMVIEMVPFTGAVQRLAGTLQLTSKADQPLNGQDNEGRELTFNCLAQPDGTTLYEWVCYVDD